MEFLKNGQSNVLLSSTQPFICKLTAWELLSFNQWFAFENNHRQQKCTICHATMSFQVE